MPCNHRKNKQGRCRTCESRKYRESNPMMYAYLTLRSNCIRRKGIGWFELTFDEFKQFAVETKYIMGKGKSKTSYTIDRTDSTMGYFIGNIAVRTNSFNSSKRQKSLVYEWSEHDRCMMAYVVDSFTPPPKLITHFNYGV
jgi:hypothetical protein